MPEPTAYPVTVTRRASGADLDVTPFVRHLLTDLIGLLGDEKSDLMEDLDRTLAFTPADRFAPEPELPTEGLVERLLTLLPTEIRVHGPELEQLVTELAAVAGRQKPAGVAA